jgi:hypothetical protein
LARWNVGNDLAQGQIETRRILPATGAVSNPFTAAAYGKTDIEATAPDAVPGDVEAAKIRATKTIAKTP